MKTKIKLQAVLFAAILTAFATSADAQCTVKCQNESATATAIDQATGVAFTVPQHTITWNSTLPFTGQGTPVITFASVGSTPGQYTVSYTVTDGNCDTTITTCIEVIVPAPPTADVPIVCLNGSCTQLSGVNVAPSGGVWTNSSGAAITQVCSPDIAQTVTYSVVSGGCSGSIAVVVGSRAAPNGIITVN